MKSWALICCVASLIAACAAGSDEPAHGTLTPDPSTTTPLTTTAQSTVVAVSPGSPPSTSALMSPACEAPATGSQRDVLIWHSLSNDAKLKLEEQTERFNAIQKEVVVRLEAVGNSAEALRALGRTAPGDRPDAVLGDHKATRTLFDSGLTVRPGACTTGDAPLTDLLPVVEATFTLDGELLALPFSVSTPVLMFDKTKLELAGLDPDDPPATLEELTAANEAVIAAGAAAFGMVAWDGYGPWFVTQFNGRRGELSGFPQNGRAGEPVETVEFATEEIVARFEWLRAEVAASRAIWIEGNSSGIDDLLQAVDPERGAAFTFNSSGAIGDLMRVLEAGLFPGVELGVSPLPGPGDGSLAGGSAFWLIDSGEPQRVGATYAYLRWLLEPPQHGEFVAYTGYSPVRTSALDDPALVAAWDLHPELRVAYDQLEPLPADVVWAGPAWGAGTEINRILYETMTAVIDGGDAAGHLATATAQTNTLLDEYNAAIGTD